MNKSHLQSKMIISLLVSLMLSVLYLPAAWHPWMPPWTTLVLFYWLTFQSVRMNVWGLWLVGLLSGLLLGDTLGISSLLMMLLGLPILYYKRMIQFMAASSCWLIWLLPTILFFCLKLLLMAILGQVEFSWANLRPVLSILVVSPAVYFILSIYAQFSLSRKRRS